MTDIWALLGHFPWEGNVLIGVYSSQEKAEKGKELHQKSDDRYEAGYIIEPYELDKKDRQQRKGKP